MQKNPNNLPTDNPISFLKDFFRELIDIRDGVDKESTVESILSNINFRGFKAWILIFSILIASIGLNTNSVAVIIGAMLISPLMGPIIGIGYAVAVNDYALLKRSLLSFGTAVMVSLITSFLYFWINPFSIETTELRNRIEPTLLDVLVAICGGLAGILAASRKDIVTVIPGVAIATALMPPLCTAGYGWATGKLDYFAGALYLFYINSLFIAIATFLVVKVLRFPLAKYQNDKEQNRTHIIILVFALISIIPSIFIFYKVVQESIFRSAVVSFIDKEIKTASPYISVNYSNDNIIHKKDTSLITIGITGANISQQVIDIWKERIKNPPYNLKTRLNIIQGIDYNSFSKMNNTAFNYLLQIQKKDSIINHLKEEVSNNQRDSTVFDRISKELKIQHPEIVQFGYALVHERVYRGDKHVQIPTFILHWQKTKVPTKSKENQIKEWLKQRLQIDTLVLKTETVNP